MIFFVDDGSRPNGWLGYMNEKITREFAFPLFDVKNELALHFFHSYELVAFKLHDDFVQLGALT